jgi:nuclear transport factor 2 (NTF2) superfamily protein
LAQSGGGFSVGRDAAQSLLERKRARELDYRLIKEVWANDKNRFAVYFVCAWHDDAGNWFRSYGNENWEYNAEGLMTYRHASINDQPIKATEEKFF